MRSSLRLPFGDGRGFLISKCFAALLRRRVDALPTMSSPSIPMSGDIQWVATRRRRAARFRCCTWFYCWRERGWPRDRNCNRMTGLAPGESVAQLLVWNVATLSAALATVALMLRNCSGNKHADEGGASQPIRLCQFRGFPFLVGCQCASNRRNLWIFPALRVTHVSGITDPSKTSTANCSCVCDEEPLLANACGTSLASAIGCGKRPAARALASAISSHSLSLRNGNFSNPE